MKRKLTKKQLYKINEQLARFHKWKPSYRFPAVPTYTSDLNLCFQLFEFLKIDDEASFMHLSKNVVVVSFNDICIRHEASTYAEAFAICLLKYLKENI
jgi:hypothetical protein